VRFADEIDEQRQFLSRDPNASSNKPFFFFFLLNLKENPNQRHTLSTVNREDATSTMTEEEEGRRSLFLSASTIPIECE
jgi:hypothetical protein